jgi:hypothetical protein
VTKEECVRLITLVVKTRGKEHRGGMWPEQWVQLQYSDDKIIVSGTGPIIGFGEVRSCVEPRWFSGYVRSPVRWERPFIKLLPGTDKTDIFEDDPEAEKHLRSLVVLEELADQ